MGQKGPGQFQVYLIWTVSLESISAGLSLISDVQFLLALSCVQAHNLI